MPTRSSKDHDFTTVAKRVVEQAIGEQWDGSPLPDKDTGKNPAAARHDLFSIVLMQGVLITTFTLVLDWWMYPLLWLLPLVTVTVLFHLVRSFVEHAISASEEERHSNRLITIRSNVIERGLVAPYGMNYHAEHHLVPTVPAPRLRALRERLGGREELPPLLERRSYASALARYVRALRT